LLAPPINLEQKAPFFSPSPSSSISVTVITEFRVLRPQAFIFFYSSGKSLGGLFFGISSATSPIFHRNLIPLRGVGGKGVSGLFYALNCFTL